MSSSWSQPELPPARAPRGNGGCFHCGEPCPQDAFVLAGKTFCCFGCQTVFTLLHENGLEQFYELNPAPGTRIRAASATAKWAFLDDPAVAKQLFDYADQAQARVTLLLPAIHCVACVWLLENLFKLHPGVGKVLVNFSRREAAIAFAPGKIKFSELAALLTSIGYAPELTLASGLGGGAWDPGTGANSQPLDASRRTPPAARRTWLQIGLAAFGFGNIMLMSLPFYFGLDSFSGPWFRLLAGWLGLALALPVVTFSAADFWRAAWLAWRQRTLTLEVPIVMGLTAIYLASAVEVFARRGPGYCDSLCGLIFFLLCGRLFQKISYDRLTFDRDYKGFFPLSVTRIARADAVLPGSGAPETAGRVEASVAISRLKTGDHIVLRNGELLPADAKLVQGEACIDYSFVTGESEPVQRGAGEYLFAGGRQMGGVIEVETVKPVAQSYLATLWNHEAFRKNRDHDLSSLTNRYSRRFTKLVIGIALAAAVFWFFSDASKALKAFTSVLIVACPCALALAAPLTHGTAQRVLARLNIFLKNALVIERLAEVDTIVLDKTGTLTTAEAGGVVFQGADRRGVGQASRRSGSGEEPGARLDRRDACPTAELSLAEAGWIASLTRLSTHPNSVRIAKALGVATLPVTDFKETPGCGIEGEVAGHRILLGSEAWVVVGQASCLPGSGPKSDGQLDRGDDCPAPAGSVFVAIDGEVRGAFALENTLRPEVENMVSQLGGRFELALLSGDNEREAARFQKIFGARASLRFNQSPADKLNFIRSLQLRGRKVMMVGDGLNDAGALKQAEVGVAVVDRIGVFSPASDVILDAAELPRLPGVLQFSRHAARVVRAGFVISALYNLAGVSIAAAGWLSPIVCAILMPISSATVVAFACGATAWLGSRWSAGGLRAPVSNTPRPPLSTVGYQLSPQEAA